MKDRNYRDEFIFSGLSRDKSLFLKNPRTFPGPNKIPGHFQVFQDFQDEYEPWKKFYKSYAEFLKSIPSTGSEDIVEWNWPKTFAKSVEVRNRSELMNDTSKHIFILILNGYGNRNVRTYPISGIYVHTLLSQILAHFFSVTGQGPHQCRGASLQCKIYGKPIKITQYHSFHRLPHAYFELLIMFA